MKLLVNASRSVMTLVTVMQLHGMMGMQSPIQTTVRCSLKHTKKNLFLAAIAHLDLRQVFLYFAASCIIQLGPGAGLWTNAEKHII